MNFLRRSVQFAVDLNKIQTEAIIRLYRRFALYKKLYVACGIPEDVAARIEEAMLDAMCVGVEEQHAIVSRWVAGEVDAAGFVERYKQGFGEYLARCSNVTVEALSAASVSA